MRDQFIQDNQSYWRAFLKTLFPEGVPALCVWDHPGQIVRILNWIGTDSHVRPQTSERIHNLTHFFYPDGGGNDLIGAFQKPETDLLWLRSDRRSFTEVSPLRLTLRSVQGKAHEWAYLILEAGPLEPSGVNEERIETDLMEKKEEYFESLDGERLTRSEYKYQPNNGGRVINQIRRFGTSRFAFWSKGSHYNQEDPLFAYDAPHFKMTPDDYHKAICALASKQD